MSGSATVFVARASGIEPPASAVRHRCGACGSYEPARPARKVLKPSFTAIDTIDSPWICWACEWAFATRWTRSSIVCTPDGCQKLPRSEVWSRVLEPPQPPFVIYLTKTGQKHGLYMSRVARSRKSFVVFCESTSFVCVPHLFREWMLAVAELRVRGVSMESIVSGRYEQSDWQRAGVAVLKRCEETIRPWRPRPAFRVLTGLIPARKELDVWITSTKQNAH